LLLGSKRTVYEALGKTIGLKIARRIVGILHQTPKSKRQHIVEEPASSKTKKEATDRLSAGAVGAQATLGSIAHKPEKKKRAVVCLQATWDEQP
jgi:hypothetical protein